MEKILVIIPYFGKLPNWFQVFLNSCKNTKILDFLLVTDDYSNYVYPDNFKVEHWSFSKMQTLVNKKLGNKAYIKHPYKLCDYKSLYGYLFEDNVKNYGFWAHSDIDVIFGDIDTFLQDINYLIYDRVFPVGHFSIYRNNDKMNMLFAEKLLNNFPKYFDIDFVKQTTYPCHFDEVGMNIIIKNKQISFFEDRRHINTNINYYNLCVGNGKHKVPSIIMYDQGKILTLEKDHNTISKSEFLYVHLQGKKFVENVQPQTNQYVICRNGFIDYDINNENSYFKDYGLNDEEERQSNYMKQTNASIKNGQKQKFLREFQEYPFRGLYNIFHRFMGVKYLKENDLF